MKKLLRLLAVVLLCNSGCSIEGGIRTNGCTPNKVYIGLEGGSFELSAYSEIAYYSTKVISIDEMSAPGEYHFYEDENMPDTSSYPYTINTRWCTIEHRSARSMIISVLPSEKKRVISVSISGIDKKGKVFGWGLTGVTIHQGYPEPPKLLD